MATVNLALARVTERSRSGFWLWEGTQDLIGNTVRWELDLGWRPVSHIQLNLAGTDTPTPGGSGQLGVLAQMGDAAHEFVVSGRGFTSRAATVQYAGMTYAWMRATATPTFLSASGLILLIQPIGDSTNVPVHANNGILVIGSTLVVELNCNALTGVASVSRCGVALGFGD